MANTRVVSDIGPPTLQNEHADAISEVPQLSSVSPLGEVSVKVGELGGLFCMGLKKPAVPLENERPIFVGAPDCLTQVVHRCQRARIDSHQGNRVRSS